MPAPKATIRKVVTLKNEECMYLNTMMTGENNSISREDTVAGNSNFAPENISAEQLVLTLKKEGLTGLSGGGYPVADKIETFLRAECSKKYLIINGVECDPGLLHDEWIYQNHMEQVSCGVRILQKALNITNATVVVKSRVEKQMEGIQIVQLPARYPMGYEKAIIESILGKKLSKEDIPAEQGILVLNIQSVLAIADIISNGNHANHRYLTVADFESGEAMVADVVIGVNVKEVMEKCFAKNSNAEVYTGSGALRAHVAEENEKVSLDTNFIVLGSAPDYESASKCKGCGACTSSCPAGVKVHKIVQAVEKGQISGLEQFHPELCIGCSACTYMCRAGKNTQGIIAHVNGKC